MSHLIAVGQAFKGSLGAAAVARALGAGVEAAGHSVDIVVGSDGGDGLLDAVAPPRRTRHRVTGPIGAPVDAPIGWIDDRTAVLESRLACGVALLERGRRNPALTTTRGVGELILEAAAAGAETVIIGLGGSATMDGGLGAARAWGWRAVDSAGVELPDGGGALPYLAELECGPPLPVRLVALADVRNPLLGPEGAAVYARQKGANRALTARLIGGLERLVERCAAWDGPAVAERPGAGAAGGLGFGLMCFGGASLEEGSRWVLGRAHFDALLATAAGVVIAEATFDATSLEGKLTGEVMRQAAAAGVPVVIATPRPRLHPHGVLIEHQPGRWTPDDVATVATRATRTLTRLPAS
jgi:glycerate kinase